LPGLFQHCMRQLINKFTRVTSTGSYLPEIDGLRFLAISWVFVYHLNDFLVTNYHVAGAKIIRTIFGNGHFGVELFFVISGFVLSLPFARYYLKQGKKVYLKQYFLRRLTRLEPPYFLLMIFLFFFESGTHFDVAKQLTPHLIASLLYAHNIIYPGSLPPVNPVAWSLEIEIQFYIMMPLLASIFILQKTARRILLVAVMIVMPVIQYFCKSDILFFYQFLQYFIAGFLLADIYVNYDKQYFYKPANRIKKNVLMISGLFVLTGILMIPSSRTNLVYTIFVPLAIILFYYIVLFIPFWKRIFSIKWVSIIGGMSYTIYLLHGSVMAIFARFFVKYGITNEYSVYFIIQFFIMASLTMIASSLFFYFIERPCMQKDRYIKFYNRLRPQKPG
jgi:peptidoglycan/LPS O-acetylase OafA/YrhL